MERNRRSTLYLHDETHVVREFHDTGAVTSPMPLSVDAKGRVKCSGNRNVATLLRRRETVSRGSGDVQPSASDTPPPPPRHLRMALRVLCEVQPTSIDAFATALGVAPNTAWSYACRVVTVWPAAYVETSLMVDPDVLHAVRTAPDRTGSLTELCKRLRSHIPRELSERFAHLRLARLCADAEDVQR